MTRKEAIRNVLDILNDPVRINGGDIETVNNITTISIWTDEEPAYIPLLSGSCIKKRIAFVAICLAYNMREISHSIICRTSITYYRMIIDNLEDDNRNIDYINGFWNEAEKYCKSKKKIRVIEKTYLSNFLLHTDVKRIHINEILSYAVYNKGGVI